MSNFMFSQTTVIVGEKTYTSYNVTVINPGKGVSTKHFLDEIGTEESREKLFQAAIDFAQPYGNKIKQYYHK